MLVAVQPPPRSRHGSGLPKAARRRPGAPNRRGSPGPGVWPRPQPGLMATTPIAFPPGRGQDPGPSIPPALSVPRAALPADWTAPPPRAQPHRASPEPLSLPPPPPPPRAPTPAPSGNPGNREHRPLLPVRPRLSCLRVRVGPARAPRSAPRLSGSSGVAGVTRRAAKPKGK